MISKLCSEDEHTIYTIINQAASTYKDVIPDDCYHEPYMPKDELHREMKSMTFFGWDESAKIVAVMGFQPVKEVTLIRHAYVLPDYQRKGIGTRLLDHLKQITKTRQLLVGTWMGATWAIDFYKRQGFALMPNKDELLAKYWDVSHRQVEVSVVLGTEV